MSESSPYQIEEITCPACGYEEARVITHLLDIPYYDDFVMININCPDCGYRTSDFMNLKDKDHTLSSYRIEDETDGTTKVVRSREGIVTISELGISIEPTGDGSTWIRNIEGILEDIKEKLLISLKHSETNEDKRAIKKRIRLLKELKNYNKPFTIKVEDPSGNSVILPAHEEKLTVEIIEKNISDKEDDFEE